MAGDWIKIDHAIHEKPEVLLIAQETGLDVYGVVGRLIRVWTWFDTHTENGCANVALDAQLDAWTLCAGFATAMRKAGWLTGLGALPNFDRHNGKTAKRRAIAAETMRRTRCANVAPRAQPEKRREEKKKEEASASSEATPRPRKPNPVWDALCIAFPELSPTGDAKLIGKLCADLRTHGLDGDATTEIPLRMGRYRQEWPDCSLTPTALVKHWSHLGPTWKRPGAPPPLDVSKWLKNGNEEWSKENSRDKA